MTFRPLASTRLWTTDPSVAVRSQAEVLTGHGNQFPSPSFPVTSVYDYPNPRGPILSIENRTWTQSPSQTAPVLGLPLNLSKDYPNPRGYQYPNNLLTWINGIPLTPPSPPTSNYDFPNPRGYSYSSDLRTFTQNIAPTNPIPSNVTNWPNPLGYSYPTDLRSYTKSGFNQLEAGVVQIPAEANYDWPVPRGPQYPSDLRTHLQSTSPLLKAIVFTPPPNMTDWPNPTLKTWTPAPVVFTNALQGLAIQGPLTNKDFPNPVLRTWSPINLTWLQTGGSLLGFLEAPNAQYDYPNPRGYQYPVGLLTWTQGIIAAEDTPFRMNYDQPNPTLGRWSPVNLTFIAGISRELASVVNVPPNMSYDRTNPIWPTYPSTVRTGESYGSSIAATSTPSAVSTITSHFFLADVGRMMGIG